MKTSALVKLLNREETNEVDLKQGLTTDSAQNITDRNEKIDVDLVDESNKSPEPQKLSNQPSKFSEKFSSPILTPKN